MVLQIELSMSKAQFIPCFKEQIPYFGTAKIDDNLKNKKIICEKFSLFCSKRLSCVLKQFWL